MEVIGLKQAREVLGDVTICLEPEDWMVKKLEAGKGNELWGLNLSTGVSGRGDGKFFNVPFVDRGGWGQLVLFQEPSIEAVEETRVVAHVVVQTMVYEGQRFIRVRKSKGLQREILELLPSSYSKDELCGKEGCQPFGISEMDPQRINGDVLHFLLEEDFPVEEGMTISDFLAKTTDGRSINALAKVGLLVAKE